MESRVAARDATPAITVAAASNFCPVPPLILVDSPGAWNGGGGLDVSRSRHQAARSVSWEDSSSKRPRGVIDDDASKSQKGKLPHRGMDRDVSPPQHSTGPGPPPVACQKRTALADSQAGQWDQAPKPQRIPVLFGSFR